MGDATFNFCDAPIALMGMGVMQAGGKLAPLIYSLAPTESAEAYTLKWDSFAKSAVSFVRKFAACDDAECKTCLSIVAVIRHERTAALLEDDNFIRCKRLAVDYATSDKSLSWNSVSKDFLGLNPQKCIAHLTGMRHFIFLFCK